ncbi:MAG: FkbM family methyltransferase [Cyanobacteriota bacterium]|jgi:FkbM family methyltransferase
MVQTIKSTIKSILPRSVYTLFRGESVEDQQHKFFQQKTTTIQCGDYQLVAPESHLLIQLQKGQPYRDLCIGSCAAYIANKYPQASFLDIGANIGDTAAVMASHARNKLILVEGSDYYYEFLVKNAALLPNEVVTRKAMASDGSEIQGELRHWGGTAYFKHLRKDEAPTPTYRLSELADSHTRFVKIDTDGFECKILFAAMPWLKETHPGILFENQLRHDADLEASNQLYDQLSSIGYRYFIVWDDPGYHMLSTDDVTAVKDLNRYQYKMHQSNHVKNINNYDILCLH